MKSIFLSLAALTTLSAHAAAPSAPTACGTYIECGTYEGDGSGTDEQGNVLYTLHEKSSITSDAADTAMLTVEVTENGETRTYDLDLHFASDGSFKVGSGKGLYAAGICKGNVCNYGMMPFSFNGSPLIANSGIFRFKDGNFERRMLVVQPTQVIHQTSILKKQ